MLTVGSLTGLVKLLGAVKILILARIFGTSDALDAFLIAFVIPSLVSDIGAGSMNGALIPVYVDVRQNDGLKSAERVYRSVLGALALILCAFACVVGVLAWPVSNLLGSGFSAEKLHLTRSLLLLMLPIIPLSALSVTWRSVLNAEKRFALVAAAPAAWPLLVMATAAIAGPRWGAYSLVAGTIAGYVVEAICLGWAMARRGHSIIPKWMGVSDEVRQVFRQYWPLLTTALICSGTTLVDQAMAAMLGPGSVSALSYGTRLVLVLMAIGPFALSTATLPEMSRMAAAKDWPGLRQAIRTYSPWILFGSVPLIGLLMLYSGPLVRIMLQHGAFRAEATQAVTVVQRYSLIQFPFAMLLAPMVRLVSSLKANRLLVETAFIIVPANVLFDYILLHWLGVGGIALADTFVHVLTLIYLGLRLQRVFRDVSKDT